MTKPVALTIGEPAGVGPEIAGMAWDVIGTEVPFFLIGDPKHLPSGTRYEVIQSPAEALSATTLPVLVHAFPEAATPGRPNPANAQAVVEVIERAVALVQAGDASAVCTCPINKKVLIDGAGFAFPGHTEFLAELAGADRAVMMLAAPVLKVVPVTIHIPLSEVPRALSPELLKQTLVIVNEAMTRDFGVLEPRIAVTGLNPHASEGGAMGTEEADIIVTVLEQLKAEGVRVSGPHPADTMFHAQARETYDVLVAMYHDQALIPIKALAFDSAVNVTLGLPFVRTSPDHGTAFDIAGKGLANPASLIEALRMAHDMGKRRA